MKSNQLWKFILIIVLVVLAGWTLYPPDKTLKPGIDLAGGTSLIYEIDTTGFEPDQIDGLAGRMIRVLRRRIDPANVRNLIWRPQGDTRFEIQMPLADAQTRRKRTLYDQALTDVLEANVSRSAVMRSLKKPTEERKEYFRQKAQGSPERLRLLNELATIYDKRKQLQDNRDRLAAEKQDLYQELSAILESSEAGPALETIKSNVYQWSKLDPNELGSAISGDLGESALGGLKEHLELIYRYVRTYGQWSQVVEQLTEPVSGKNAQYTNAINALDRLNLTAEQIKLVALMEPGSSGRIEAIENLKSKFGDRTKKIDKVIAAFDDYREYRGRLDDPKDLQRMLKGAGILEFRILPLTAAQDNRQLSLSPEQIQSYKKALRDKGPKYASDDKYVWLQIEDAQTWQVPSSVVEKFGDKSYVLASNRKSEVLLYAGQDNRWQLEKAKPGADPQTGARAIDFVMDDKGAKLFAELTKNNMKRNLCICLDNIAISAPTIQSRISKRGQITGQFNREEQQDMVNKLNAGALPGRLIEPPVSINNIGSSIGAGNRNQGIEAGLIGLVVVIICVLAYYTLAGSIADAALLMNVLFVLAIMAFIRATFTLPGIAGIILTIGMSVDANVLIFERIREEQQKGSSIRLAIKNGYQKAFRTIFDANLTTFITAAILYWRASEEVKGFAIVLMLGILSSLFTALFVTRTIFDGLLSARIIKKPLFMLRLIHKPNINWMGARMLFFSCSAILIAGGLFVFFTRSETENNKYDIEFTGGTSAVITLKDEVSLSRRQVADKIHQVGNKMNNPAIEAANIHSVGDSDRQYEITTTATNTTRTRVKFQQDTQHTTDSVIKAIRMAQKQIRGKLTDLAVKNDDNETNAFVIETSQVNTALVKKVLANAFENAELSTPQVDEVVNNALKEAFAGRLKIRENLEPQIISAEKITGELIDTYPELADFLEGAMLKCKLAKPASLEEIDQRFRDLWFKPIAGDFTRYPYELLSSELKPAKEVTGQINEFIYVSAKPEAALRKIQQDEWNAYVDNESGKILAAASIETSLPRVTQIAPSIGAEAKTRAVIAIALSLFAIVAYIWVRFGTPRYGLAAIAALVHDVIITLGAITACTYLAATSIGQNLLIGDFKIDLAIIAAFLTLIGYSLNDTIVVFDRIRENRKKGRLTPEIINASINQTISRTLLTSFTTFIVVLIMYIFGGAELRGFTFAIGLGIIVGTYSSIAIASPILLLGSRGKKTKP